MFKRNWNDDRGMRLDSTVHHGVKYDNALWNGQQMVYGDGDGELFNRFTISLDVIGHELTHGVTQYEASLAYQNQPGALNESMSDVFGSMVKQYAKRQRVNQADWLTGAGLLAKGVKGVALRSMKAPGTAYADPRLGRAGFADCAKLTIQVAKEMLGASAGSAVRNAWKAVRL